MKKRNFFNGTRIGSKNETIADCIAMAAKSMKSVAVTAAMMIAPVASAGPIQLMLESNDNRQGGSEIFMAEFASSADFLAGSLSGSGFSQVNIGANFSVGGMTYDNSGYHVLLESNDNRQGGSEIFLASFSSYNDLLNGSLISGSFSQLNIGSNFSAGGLTFDDSGYHLLLESNDNRQGGSEVFMASFASYANLLAGSLGQGSFSQVNIGANFSAGGLAFDGDAYSILLESDENRQGGSELFLATFDSFGDLLNGSLSDGSFSQLNIGTNFGVAGMIALSDGNIDIVDDPAEVPEPGSMAIISLGMLALSAVRRRAVASQGKEVIA